MAGLGSIFGGGGNKGGIPGGTGGFGMFGGGGSSGPNMNYYREGVDPAVSAAKAIWGDPAVTAAENIWGKSDAAQAAEGGGGFLGGLADFFTSSPYNGHVDRMSDHDGYKTRHMREGASSRITGSGKNEWKRDTPAYQAAYQAELKKRGFNPDGTRGGGTQAPVDGWQPQTPSGVGATGVGVSPFQGGANPSSISPSQGTSNGSGRPWVPNRLSGTTVNPSHPLAGGQMARRGNHPLFRR